MELDADILNRSAVEYSNFTPDRDQKLIVTNAIRKLMLKAPARSKASLEVSAVGGFYSSTLTVQSITGTFDSSVVGETLRESLDLLYQDILAKFNIWKSTRFSSQEGIQAS